MDKAAFIAAASKHGVREIEVPDIGAVYIREISAGERDSLELMAQNLGAAGGMKSFRARCVAMFLSDENGARLFRDSELAQLESMNAKPMDFIFEAGMDFNGLSGDSVEEAEKN